MFVHVSVTLCDGSLNIGTYYVLKLSSNALCFSYATSTTYNIYIPSIGKLLCSAVENLKEFLHDKTQLLISLVFIFVMLTKLLNYEDGINGLDSWCTA
jgi:hypothetical protein